MKRLLIAAAMTAVTLTACGGTEEARDLNARAQAFWDMLEREGYTDNACGMGEERFRATLEDHPSMTADEKDNTVAYGELFVCGW